MRCGQITETFVRALGERSDLPPVQIIGGNGAAALLSDETEIDLESRTIRAPATCDLPRLRADRSVRDLDTLVLSTDPQEIEAVRLLGEESIGGELKISVFGLKPLTELHDQRRRPARSVARIFLADRYVTTVPDVRRETTITEGFKALYPFRVPITTETFDTFQLVIGGRPPAPTSHPGTTILNYLTRSISGLRAKDAAKVETMTENVLTRYPDIREWIHDGPGRDMLDLARILHTLREPRRRPQTLRLGSLLAVDPYPLAELGRHPGFMASQQRRGAQRLIIEATHLKAWLLGTVESNPRVVSFWQKHIEDRVDAIVHNEP